MLNDRSEEIDVLNLSTANTLSEEIIEQYDYLLFKNNFERLVNILNINKIVHQ